MCISIRRGASSGVPRFHSESILKQQQGHMMTTESEPVRGHEDPLVSVLMSRIAELEAELKTRPRNVTVTRIEGEDRQFLHHWRNQPIRAGVQYFELTIEMEDFTWKFLAGMFSEVPNESCEVLVCQRADGKVTMFRRSESLRRTITDVPENSPETFDPVPET